MNSNLKSKISGMIATNYNPKASEEKWYKYWMDHKLFHSEVDNSREPYCIVIPPWVWDCSLSSISLLRASAAHWGRHSSFSTPMKSVRFQRVSSPSPRQVQRMLRPMAPGVQPKPSWASQSWFWGVQQDSLRVSGLSTSTRPS